MSAVISKICIEFLYPAPSKIPVQELSGKEAIICDLRYAFYCEVFGLL